MLMAAVATLSGASLRLAAAAVRLLSIFNNSEFLMLTVIRMTQAVVAMPINTRNSSSD